MKRTPLKQNQSGLVAFVVVLAIMLILTLIVLSFGRLVRREQRQALDRQLNTQAFYAAESGVNDALNALDSGTLGAYNDNCDGPGSFMDEAGLNQNVDNSIAYSCLLVDDSPPQLEYEPVSTQGSTVVPLRPATGVITRLEISWDDADGGTTLSGCPAVGQFPQNWSNSCNIGMLRLELVQFNGGQDRLELIRDRGIVFLSPSTTGFTASRSLGGATGINADNQGMPATTPIRADCRGLGPGPRRCSFVITGLTMSQGYLRMLSLYRPVGVTIRAFNGAGSGSQVDLEGAQAEIDVTGRANDILRRIKVTAAIPDSNGIPLPDYALQTTRTQCKRFSLSPTAASPVWFAGDPSMPACTPTTP